MNKIHLLLNYLDSFCLLLVHFLSIRYFNVTPIIPDKTDKIIETEIVIPVFVPSLTLKHDAINTLMKFQPSFLSLLIILLIPNLSQN